MLALAGIMQEAGLPDGVLNVVTTSDPAPVIEPMIRDGRARKLSFTGSTAVGRKLLEQCADQVMRTSMELGGNAPFLVFDDADLDVAVEGAMQAKMRNIGEACTAANRFYVHSSVADEFARRLGERMAALPIGRGVEEGVVVGPLIDAAARDKVVLARRRRRARGAEVVVGGRALDGDGYFYPPTVLTNVPEDAQMRHEEIFGPVAPVVTFETEDEAIAAANDTEYGLACLRLHARPGPRVPGLRATRDRDDRPQPGHRLQPGGAVRRHEALGPGPRGRSRRDRRVPGDQVRRDRHDGLSARDDEHDAKTRRIALIPGDGIGTEVAASARAVLAALDARHDLGLLIDEFDWSCQRYLDTGRPHACRRAGHPAPVRRRPAGRRRVARRTRPRLLVGSAHPDPPGLQPVRESAASPLVRRGDRSPGRMPTTRPIDLVIVRENNEGEYSEVGGRFGRGGPDETAIQEAVFTRRGISRIADYALQVASGRRRHLTSATKSNGLVHSMPFWDEVVRERAALMPEVELVEEHIDALAAKLVLRPESFDVIVASNLFGDILSDLAAAVTGSIGIAPSANLDPTREHPSMFEPVHGSAPDIAGKGLANPIGMLWSAALMLEHLDAAEPAARLMDGHRAVATRPATRTADVGGTASTEQVTTALLRILAAD